MTRVNVKRGRYGQGLFLASDDGENGQAFCNEVLFYESPVEVIAVSFSRDHDEAGVMSSLVTRLCIICLRPLDNLLGRIRRLVRLQRPPFSFSLNKFQKESLNKLWEALKEGQRPSTSDSPKREGTSQCVSCLSEVCSETCSSLLTTSAWHRMVCTSLLEKSGPSPTKSPAAVQKAWKKFLSYGYRHYEGFILAARLILRIGDAYESGGIATAFERKRFLLSYAVEANLRNWAKIRCWKKAKALCYEAPDDSCVLEEEEICLESFRLLFNFLRVRADFLIAQDEGSDPFLLDTADITFEYYLQILMQFELVNADVALEDTMKNELLHWIDQTPQLPDWFTPCEQVFRKVAHILYPTQKNTHMTLTDCLADVFPDIMGYSYCPLLGLINHSCLPNVSFETAWSTDIHPLGILKWSAHGICSDVALVPLYFKMVTLTEIQPGDELFLSYIDEHLSLAERSRLLRYCYQFICRCPKCLDDAKALLEQNQKKKSSPNSLNSC